MIPWKSIEKATAEEFMLLFEQAKTIVISGNELFLIINKYTLVNVDEFILHNVLLMYEVEDYDWEFFTIMPFSLNTIMNHHITKLKK